MSHLHDELKQLPFYLSRPQPCPYLQGQVEQKIFTRLIGDKTGDFLVNSSLNLNGFRRSQSMVYRPACPTCMACVPVRIDIKNFVADARLRRISRKNTDLDVHIEAARATERLYSLFARYQHARHRDSDMAYMPKADFEDMVQDGAANAQIITLSTKGTVIGAMLMDRLTSGTSAVYSFFDPAENKRSLGTELILRLVEYTGAESLPYVYLGYWIKDCQKMNYKAHFPALERLGPHGWEAFKD